MLALDEDPAHVGETHDAPGSRGHVAEVEPELQVAIGRRVTLITHGGETAKGLSTARSRRFEVGRPAGDPDAAGAERQGRLQAHGSGREVGGSFELEGGERRRDVEERGVDPGDQLEGY